MIDVFVAEMNEHKDAVLARLQKEYPCIPADNIEKLFSCEWENQPSIIELMEETGFIGMGSFSSFYCQKVDACYEALTKALPRRSGEQLVLNFYEGY